MKIFYPLMSLAAYAAAQGSTTASPSACPSLLSPASPMNSFIKPYLEEDDIEMAIELLPESWQGCLGSLNPLTLLPTVTTALTTPSCQATSALLLPMLTPTTTQKPTKPNKTSTDDIDYPKYASWLNVSDSEIRKVCDPLTKSILPCLNDGIIAPIYKQFISNNQCCSGMIAEIKAATGETPDAFLASALKYSSNVVCTVQTPGFDGAKDQTCGYSWYKSFIQGVTAKNTSALATRVATAIQVPNDQGCAAVQGDAFKTTTGAAVTALFTKPTVPGSCANSADDLLTWFRKFPVWSNYTLGAIRPLDLFEDGKCVKGTDILPLFGNSTKVYKELGVTKEQIGASCFHLANGGFSTCKFSDTSASAIPTNSSSTPAPTTKSSSQVVTASVVVSSLALMSWAL